MKYAIKINNYKWLAVFWVLSLGCSAKEPPPIKQDGAVDVRKKLDVTDGCPNPSSIPLPSIDSPAGPATQAKYPIRGTAVGAAEVIPRIDGINQASWTVGVDGRFCANVDLVAGKSNRVEVLPRTSAGCFGNASAPIDITYQQGAQTDVLPTLKNYALNASASWGTRGSGGDTGVKGTTGSDPALKNVLDGVAETAYRFGFDETDTGACDKYAWVKVNLASSVFVRQLVVEWAQNVGNEYAVCFTILLSRKDNPEDPVIGSPDWDPPVYDALDKSGTAAGTEYSLSPGQIATWAAFLMYENGGRSLFKENFNLAEFQVLGDKEDSSTTLPLCN